MEGSRPNVNRLSAYYIHDSCPFCGAGPSVFRISTQSKLCVIYIECEALWFDPRIIDNDSMLAAIYKNEIWTVGEPGDQIYDGGSSWAKLEEIVRRGYANLVVGEVQP